MVCNFIKPVNKWVVIYNLQGYQTGICVDFGTQHIFSFMGYPCVTPSSCFYWLFSRDISLLFVIFRCDFFKIEILGMLLFLHFHRFGTELIYPINQTFNEYNLIVQRGFLSKKYLTDSIDEEGWPYNKKRNQCWQGLVIHICTYISHQLVPAEYQILWVLADDNREILESDLGS